MSTGAMTSRERVLAAIARRPTDYVPCSPAFNPLTPQQRIGRRWQFPWGNSRFEMVDYCVRELGVDPLVAIPVGGFYPDQDVTSRAWLDGDLLRKVWTTPAGDLEASVRYDARWPHGRDIPMFDDFNVGHFAEPWLKTPADLECLRHILLPLRTAEQLAAARFAVAEARRQADEFQLATFSAVGAGMTGAMQLCGATEVCLMTREQPDLLDAYLELEHQLNLRHMEIAMDMGADIIRRNGFYETADFYGPKTLERFLGQRLRREIQTVHEAGRLIAYTIHTGVMPILDHLASLGFDNLSGIDIAFEGVDLRAIREKLAGDKSFWIGPSSTYHMWSEDSEVVRQAVREVFEVFGHTGMLLGPGVSAHSIMPWKNTLAMIDEWKKLR